MFDTTSTLIASSSYIGFVTWVQRKLEDNSRISLPSASSIIEGFCSSSISTRTRLTRFPKRCRSDCVGILAILCRLYCFSWAKHLMKYPSIILGFLMVLALEAQVTWKCNIAAGRAMWLESFFSVDISCLEKGKLKWVVEQRLRTSNYNHCYSLSRV
jgi:hypothetical protein